MYVYLCAYVCVWVGVHEWMYECVCAVCGCVWCVDVHVCGYGSVSVCTIYTCVSFRLQ